MMCGTGGSHLQAWGNVLRRNHACCHRTLDVPPPELAGSQCVWLEPPACGPLLGKPYKQHGCSERMMATEDELTRRGCEGRGRRCRTGHLDGEEDGAGPRLWELGARWPSGVCLRPRLSS